MAQDRRRVRPTEPDPEGCRKTDPRLTTRDCADRLGVSPAFVVGEILDGRLRAIVLKRPGRRRVYRIAPADLEAYVQAHRWTGQTPRRA